MSLRFGRFWGGIGLLFLGASCASDAAPMLPREVVGAAGSGATQSPATHSMQPPAATTAASSPTPAAPSTPPPSVQPPAGMGTPVTPPPVSNPGVQPPVTMPGTPAGMLPKPLAMDECGLKTKFAGDNYCILPPPPDKGFQVHVGPTNYDNPEAKYILNAGDELTSDFQVVSTNDQPIHFYYRQFRMRPGAHHNIITLTTGGGFGMGRRIGTSNNLAEDSPKDGIIAPENQGVGIPMAARSTINVNLHSINTSDKAELRELWINFWYRDPSEVKEEVEEMFQVGSTSFAVQPGQDTVLGPFKCTISGNGRMLWFYGHRHASNVRFSAWRNRGAQRDLFYQGLHWEEPIVLEYSSTVKNTAPTATVEGGWSGVLDMKAGDVLEWECHVVNKTDGILRFTNETYTGEMCIMDAELVGANCASLGGALTGGGV